MLGSLELPSSGLNGNMQSNYAAKLSVNITEPPASPKTLAGSKIPPFGRLYMKGCQDPNYSLSYLPEPQERQPDFTMNDENRKPRHDSQDVADSQSAGQNGKVSPVVEARLICQDGLMPTAENVIRSALSATGLYSGQKTSSETPDKRSPKDAAKVAGAQIAETTTAAAETVSNAAKEVGAAVSDSAHKATENLEKEDDSLGPYGNPGTCFPSDIDPLAGAIHTGLDLRQDENGGGENSGSNNPNGSERGKSE
ncbi:hypothetical protein HDK90DRAFT_469099 [Phyllosticta capitalensis]|uniref:Uncharacterized protein n=1 Tax=Phyllosticta capitalensis TaxID=121624 RepID=A0ABR1YER8_9PEZI